MKHPSLSTLALHAGGDLGVWARWRTGRHLSGCSECRRESARFAQVRELIPELAETPELSWNRLAAEMKANIRLGLAAGECVGHGGRTLRDTPLFSGARVAAALAGALALVAAGLVLERPVPVEAGVVVQATSNGIQVREGRQALRLIHSGVARGDVTYSTDAQGSMRARYVDPETGYVTIQGVNAE